MGVVAVTVILMVDGGSAESGGNDILVGTTVTAIVLMAMVMILGVWCSIFSFANSTLPPPSSMVFSAY